jgi:hypothetical protein
MLPVCKIDVTIKHVSFSSDDANETHSNQYAIIQVRDFETDFGGYRF